MTRIRLALGAQVALVAVAAAVLAVIALVAVDVLSFHTASASALALACSRFALPDAGAASLAALALGSLAAAVVLRVTRSLVRQAAHTRAFLRALRVTAAGPRGSIVFAHDAPRAFCAGLLRPRVFVSDAALRTLGPAELEAVLAHEGHHQRVRDPLRIALARAAGEGLFFFPAARTLAARYGSLAELAADDAAVRARGARALASALLTFEGSHPAAIGIAPERVEHLLGETPSGKLPLPLLAWSSMMLILGGAIALRLHAARPDAMVNLPLVAAQSCMLLMAVAPLALGAAGILGAGNLARRLGSS